MRSGATGARSARGWAEVVANVDVPASPEQTWAAATDWARQGEWVLLTDVALLTPESPGIGAQLRADTGIGPLRVRDTMRVVEWDPPRRATVAHTGRIIRGSGIFEVARVDDRHSRFTWTEVVEVPLGVVGRLGWPLAKLPTERGLRLSLKRFRDFVVAYPAPVADG